MPQFPFVWKKEVSRYVEPTSSSFQIQWERKWYSHMKCLQKPLGIGLTVREQILTQFCRMKTRLQLAIAGVHPMHAFSFACALWLNCALRVWPCKDPSERGPTCIAHLVVATPPFCAILPLAVSGAWQRLKNTKTTLEQSKSDEDFILLTGEFLGVGGNHGADCQSAGSQIDPISFILQRTICEVYLSCAPEEVPPPVFEWCLTHEISHEEWLIVSKKHYSLFMRYLGKISEDKKKDPDQKKQQKITATTTTSENVVLKKWRWVAEKLWLLRRASDRHTVNTPSLKYLGLTKSSHWLFVMEKAPPSCWSWQFSPSL